MNLIKRIGGMVDKCLPYLWSLLWVITITAVSFGATIWSINWLLTQLLGMLGVM